MKKFKIDSITEVTSQTGELPWLTTGNNSSTVDKNDDENDNNDDEHEHEELAENFKPITNVLLFSSKVALIYSGNEILFSLSNVSAVLGWTSNSVQVEQGPYSYAYDSVGSQIAVFAVQKIHIK
jgi:hypothetical protein